MQEDLDEIFYNKEPKEELQKKIDSITTQYAWIGAIAIMALLIPTSNRWMRIALDLAVIGLIYSLWGLSPILKPEVEKLSKKQRQKFNELKLNKLMENSLLERNSNIHRDAELQQEGLDAERRIAQMLKDAFKDQKVKVYSRLDEGSLVVRSDGKQKDLDIATLFPNGKWFAISVKKREARKIILDKNNEIRLLRKGATERMLPDPAQQVIDQEKWLRQNRKRLLAPPNSSIVLPSVRILVVASPTIVGEQEPHQYASIGDQKFVKVERGKDFVYLLQEDQLCNFIQAVLALN